MTIEEEFFRTFEIKRQVVYLVMDMGQSHICDKETLLINKHLFKEKSRRCYVKAVNWVYPEITDRKLLQLICIANNYPLDRETLKNEVLQKLLFLESNKFTRDDIRPQVRKLFEE